LNNPAKYRQRSGCFDFLGWNSRGRTKVLQRELHQNGSDDEQNIQLSVSGVENSGIIDFNSSFSRGEDTFYDITRF